MPAKNASPDARDEVIGRLSWGLCSLALMFGVAIIGCHIESGPRRWTAAAWQFALQVPGSPATWGVVILAAGLLMLYGKIQHHRRCFHYGTCTAFVWFIVLCGASLLAFFNDEAVNPLSAISWGCIAFGYALLSKLTGKQNTCE